MRNTLFKYLYFSIGLVGLSYILCSCTLDDERDECCQGIVMDFRYENEHYQDYNFQNFIHSIRNFLFDENGIFLREIPQNKYSLRRLHINGMESGKYTIISLANSTNNTITLDSITPGISKIEDFNLKISSLYNDTIYSDIDDIYWSKRDFTVIRGRHINIISDFSNIHSTLDIKIEWEGTPKYEDKYTFELQNVATGYSLDPKNIFITNKRFFKYNRTVEENEPSENLIVQTFPGFKENYGTIRNENSFYGSSVISKITTLRYSNDHIPIFQLLHKKGSKYEEITKKIDLKKAFDSWSWYPDDHIDQEYKIKIKILKNGHYEVSQWAEGSISDWQDGGVIG